MSAPDTVTVNYFLVITTEDTVREHAKSADPRDVYEAEQIPLGILELGFKEVAKKVLTDMAAFAKECGSYAVGLYPAGQDVFPAMSDEKIVVDIFKRDEVYRACGDAFLDGWPPTGTIWAICAKWHNGNDVNFEFTTLQAEV